MYKLMIIDDEYEIRNGIKNVIPWEKHKITICGEASNGKEALSLIQTRCPDILLVDIRMPVLDGLELLTLLKSENNPAKAIILSSYDEFAYAQKAVGLGVKAYLLKPCRPQQILEAVFKVIGDIEATKNVEQRMVALYKHCNYNEPILKERYLYTLLDNLENDRHAIKHTPLPNLNISLKNVTVIVIKSDHHHALMVDDIKLEIFCIINISSEILGKSISLEMLSIRDQVVILANLHNRETSTLNLLRSIQDYLQKHLNMSVSMGISSCAKDITQLSTAYEHALIALGNTFYFGANSIIQYNEDLEQTPDTFEYPVNEQSELFCSLRNNTIEEVNYTLDKFFNALNKCTPSKDFFIQCCSSLLIALYQFCTEKNLYVDVFFDGQVLTLIKNAHHSTQYELKDKIRKTLQHVYESIHKYEFNNDTINLCTKYIQEHYNEDLNLQKIADIAYISPGYLSQLFKQVMDVNFIDYVHKIRIENACEFLKDLSLKTYEIAPMLGYSTEKYFSKKFKKYMNMTPSEYRKKYCSLLDNL